jgi:hypothetical protein
MRDASGNCPGGLSVTQWNRIEYSANNRMTPEARGRVMELMNAGRIKPGFSAAQRLRHSIEGKQNVAATASRLTGDIQVGGIAFQLSSGDLAFVLAHETEHLEQSSLSRSRTRELNADAYACANTRDRNVTSSGATAGTTCGAPRQ